MKLCLTMNPGMALFTTFEDGNLLGIVSIGDVVKSRIDELKSERDQLESYIDQG